MIFLIFGCLVSASPNLPETDASITVEAHRDREVYVAPVQIRNEADDIEGVISDYSHFGYAATYAHNAVIKTKYGSHEPFILNHEGLKFYNEETIKYSWENCDYGKDAKKCSYVNSHYLLETHITISNAQLVVEMFLFDPELQIISQGKQTSTRKIKWIKQQEIRTNINTATGVDGLSQRTTQQNCSQGSCDGKKKSEVSGYYQRETTIDKPMEGLPLKWEIPHRLLDRHIQQASLLLWCSTKFKE